MGEQIEANAPPVTSSGVVVGDNPIHYALLLLIIQIALIIALSRILTLVLRPLRQPRVVAEILGGILLGPTVFGYIPGFSAKIFPTSSLTVLNTVANMGLIFFLFLVGLELDLRSLSKTGKAALWMAVAGIVLPFGLGVVVSLIIFNLMKNELKTTFGPFTVFIGVSLSITAFPVLARILAERKLLTTDLGRMAMSAAAVNDVVAWILLALAVAITNAGSSPLVALWVLLLGIAFILFMFLLVRPVAFALANYEDPIPESVVAVTMVLVLGAAFLTDIIGIHVIFGAFICGLIIPKDGPFAGMLIEKIEDYVSILFLPLYFAASGLNTQLSTINSGTAVGILALVLGTACLGKILGTFLVAKLFGVDTRKSFTLGFLMNTKGLVELIVLNIGLQKGVINEELFAIMVIMAIVTTFMTTPIVMWLHPPARDVSPYRKRKLDDTGTQRGELRLLTCAHGARNLPATVHFTEMLKGKSRKSLRVFVLHLMEFSERSSAIRIASMARRGGRPQWRSEGGSELDTVEVTFQTYGQLSGVKVRTTIAISGYNNMHEDICSTAAINRAHFVLLPFHKYYRQDGSLETTHSGFHYVNSMVLRHSPCSVGVLVDRGFGGSSAIPVNLSQHICVLFFGGPDDREALTLARRMTLHHGVRLTVIQCLVRFPEPHNGHGIHRVTSDAFLGHIPVRNGKVQISHSIKQIARAVSNFFKAPYRTNEPNPEGQDPAVEAAVSQSLSQEHPLPPPPERNGHIKGKNSDTSLGKENKEFVQPEAAATLPTEELERDTQHETNVKMDEVEQENEKKLDMQALAPLLAGGSSHVQTNDSLQFANSRDGISNNLRLQVWEMEDPFSALTDVSRFADYGLVIVGLHSNNRSPILQMGALSLSSAHGLGPIGSLFVSRELRHMRASVLVVQQHHPSQGQIAFSGVPDNSLDTQLPSREEDGEVKAEMYDATSLTTESFSSGDDISAEGVEIRKQ